MELHQTQKIVANDTHRYRVCCTGRRWGKTTLAVWEMFGKAVAKNGRRIVYIAPTFSQARDIAWQELKNVCRPLIITANESRLEITIKTQNGGVSQIWLRGWEAVESLRGQKFDFLVVDEISSMRNWKSNWQEVVRPTLTDSKGEVLFISTPKGFNHFHELFNKQDKDSDFKSFQFTSYDNPFIPPEEVDKARQELTEDRFAQEYLADFRKVEGLVYKEFNSNFHTFTDTEIRTVNTFAGLDFGFNNPAALIVIQKDYDGVFWVTDEWYKSGKTEQEVADYTRSLGLNYVYPDPENPSAIEVLKRSGVNIREVTKGKGSIQTGINTVRELLKQGKLKISRDCVNLIWELETYCYDEKKSDKNEPEIPIKENDHAVDALRYALSMESKPQYISQSVREPKIKSFE